MKTLRALALSFIVCASLFAPLASAQTAARFPQPRAQFLDANGYPLSGGLVYTCVSGSSCPGTPQATYTTAAGTVANANPIVLDASGSADIWFSPSLLYKVVVQNSSGVTISTTDSLGDGGAAVSNSLAANLASATTGKGAALVAYLPTVTGGVGRTVQAKLDERRSAKDFGAKGDAATDDTAAIQSCINWSQSGNGASCYLPGGRYKITGSGLLITGSATLRGDAPEGGAMPYLIYYGTASALTVGNGTTLAYSVTLNNVGIAEVDGGTAQYGINVQGVTEANWHGVLVGGGLTSGKFTVGVHFIGSSGISIEGLIVSNQETVMGSTAVQFDEGGSGFGYNSNITISHADLFFQDTMFDLKSCDDCRVLDAINIEGFDYLIKVDNTTASAARLNSFRFQNCSITANESTYFTNRKLAYVNAVTGQYFFLYALDFINNRVIVGAPTVSYPVQVATATTLGYANIRFAGNVIYGLGNALTTVSATTAFAHLMFGWNHVYDNTATVREPDVIPLAAGAQYFIDEALPLDSNARQLKWTDINGTDYRAGARSAAMTRPTPGALVQGAIYGTDISSATSTDGFIRIGTIGGPSNLFANYCDFSGSSSVTDMHNNIVCFQGGNERLRMDGTGTKIGGPNYSYIQGFMTVTVSGLSFSAPAAVPGCTDASVTISGLAVSDRLTVGPPSLPGTNWSVNAYATGANTATVRWCQFSGAAAAPPTGFYTVTAIR